VTTLDLETFTANVGGEVYDRWCAASAGFRADDEVPDWEGIVYFTRRRARP
jgi:hypothetical protein